MVNQYYRSFEELPVMLTIPQVAKVLSISRAGAYELAHSRNFPAMLIGSRIVVPKDRLLAWVDQRPLSAKMPASSQSGFSSIFWV